MHNRIITALVLAIFFILVLVFFSPLFVAIIFSLISLQAYSEWLILAKVKSNVQKLSLTIFLFLMILLMYLSNYYITAYINTTYLIFWAFITIDILSGSRVTKLLLKRIPALIGLLVILFSWYLILSFNTSNVTAIVDNQGLLFFKDSIGDNLNYYFILLLTLVSLTDISAYIVGKKFGSIPLSKEISPNKTVEGFLSSLLIPVTAIYFLLPNFFNIQILLADLFFIFLCCAYCTIGDLFVSILKRLNDAKDTGSLLPGHGGALDRIDSYLPVIPIFQLWLFL